MSSITSLPPEVLLETFKYLLAEDLINNIQHVCSKWKELARHPSLWKDFVYSKGLNTTNENAISFVKKCPMLKHIQAYFPANLCPQGLEEVVTAVIKNCSDVRTFCVQFDWNYLTLSHVEAICEAFPNLEFFEINVDCPNAVEIVDRVSKSTKLKKLTVRGELYCGGILKPLVGGCPALNYLCIQDANIPEKDLYILQNMKDRLSYLKLSDSQPVTQQMINMLGTFTKLEDVTLTYRAPSVPVNFLPLTSVVTLKCLTFCSYAEDMNYLDHFFDALFCNPFPLLEKLSINISSCQCDRDVVKGICQYYPKLKSLHLYKHPSSMKDTFDEISKLQHLESLVYPRSETITDDDIKHISQCCKLKHVELINCTGLTDETVMHLANCELLENLNLHFCSLSERCLHMFLIHFKKLKILKICCIKAGEKDLEIFTKNMPLLKIEY